MPVATNANLTKVGITVKRKLKIRLSIKFHFAVNPDATAGFQGNHGRERSCRGN
jgi:hypothetical protein